MNITATLAPIDRILDDFAFLDDWDDRYRYLIELGRGLAPLAPEAHNDANKVQGCASQVWLEKNVRQEADGPHLDFKGDSDALIVRGLVAIVIALFSGRPAAEIVETDAEAVFEKIGLREHLTAQRSNGLRSMVNRIKTEAGAAAAG
ncbi:cysteine desulfuration protein SufE [Kaistia sp. 32K]|uniref:SufE family protein n=1 Tax=Kaistia sp. 32K TaxID=2795690 RepID=UPI0019353173|nr:SufE family protein [Kaistia sp. 32K]BCP52778.1 cysteine desulfuration protein SufE [Kaistia sp. 32K]